MRVSFLCALLVLSSATFVIGQDANFASGPQYLMNGSPLFARSLSTPSLSLAGPALDIGASSATDGLTVGADNQTASPRPFTEPNLFPIYYGRPSTSATEISFAETSSGYPTERLGSILDTGVSQLTTVQALRERGYGVTLGGAAAYEKKNAGHATRIYTNADIDRLRGGS
jgi:hypothetical protein